MSLIPSVGAVLMAGIVLLAAGTVIVGLRTGGRIDPAAQVRGRLLAAIGAAVLLLVVCAALDDAIPGALGRPLAASPGVAAAGALLTFGALPWRRDRREGTRSAPLRRRSAGDAVGIGGVAVVAAPAIVLTVVLAVAGAAASSDGRSFTTGGPGWSGTAGPFPGWFYGAPVAASLVLLAGAAVVALRRTALLPELFPEPDRDRLWRRSTGAVVLAVAAAACLLDLAGALWAVTGTMRSTVATGDLNGFAVDGTLRVLLPVAGIGCWLCALGAVALIAVAAARAAGVARSPGLRAA